MKGNKGDRSPCSLLDYRFRVSLWGLTWAVFFLSFLILCISVMVAMMFAQTLRTIKIMSLVSIFFHLLSLSLLYHISTNMSTLFSEFFLIFSEKKSRGASPPHCFSGIYWWRRAKIRLCWYCLFVTVLPMSGLILSEAWYWFENIPYCYISALQQMTFYPWWYLVFTNL